MIFILPKVLQKVRVFPKHRGVEQLVACRAHNPEAGGSSPSPATKQDASRNRLAPLFFTGPSERRFGVVAGSGYLRIMKGNVIREIRPGEIPLLNDFLYEAIFIPEGVAAPPRSIIENEDLQVYVRDFGKKADDRCLVAEVDGKIVGAVWTRVMDDYGHIAEGIPSLAISLYKDYRRQGIGTKLLREMLQLLQRDGYPQVSLSGQKENFAFRMYQKAGFEVQKETEEEYLMVCRLQNQ